MRLAAIVKDCQSRYPRWSIINRSNDGQDLLRSGLAWREPAVKTSRLQGGLLHAHSRDIGSAATRTRFRIIPGGTAARTRPCADRAVVISAAIESAAWAQ
jgi:hypothetical protein